MPRPRVRAPRKFVEDPPSPPPPSPPYESDSYRHGGYHHRGGLPDMGHIYNPDGSLVSQYPWGSGPPKTKRKRQGRRGRKGHGMGKHRARHTPKPRAVRVHPAAGAGYAGTATVAYPTATQTTGGAMPVRELDALAEVGLTPILADLVNHGSVTLGHTLAAWQREQDRITNRTWRRPGGLVRPAGL